MRNLLTATVVLAAVGLGGVARGADFVLTSPQFDDDGKLAVKNAGNNRANPNCIGDNISPPLAWRNPPPGTESYALLLLDPEGNSGVGAVLWVAYGIPVSVTSLAEGEGSKTSDKFVAGKGTAGPDTIRHDIYRGPCPPPGDWHHYIFTLIASDLDPKALKGGLTREELLAALNGHAKGAASIIGRFKHQ
jgi:Raf kinase inhibitor-like YbhB/YbcL family protein